MTKKFKDLNQHQLIFWLNELAPENKWESGEIAFRGFDLLTDMDKMFSFGVYINRDHKTLNLAELRADNIESESDLLTSAMHGKEIISVMRGENIEPAAWDDSFKFQKMLHQVLMKYVERKEELKRLRILRKNS